METGLKLHAIIRRRLNTRPCISTGTCSCHTVWLDALTSGIAAPYASAATYSSHSSRAKPKVSMQVGSEQIRATARTATGQERTQLWKQLAEIYPPYDDYQTKAGAREIPVVVLDPVAG